MELRLHFEAYRRGIKPDLLEGVIDFTRKLPTQQADRFPTVNDLLAHCVSEIKRHIQFNDIYNYKKIIQSHQKILLTVLEKFVDNFLDEYVKTYGLSNDLIKDFITEQGWKWFKFCKYSYIHNEKFLVFPRYYCSNRNLWDGFDKDSNLLSLDTEELLLLSAKKRNPLSLKTNGDKIIGFQDNDIMMVPVEGLNQNWEVHDWTAPLFSGVSK